VTNLHGNVHEFVSSAGLSPPQATRQPTTAWGIKRHKPLVADLVNSVSSRLITAPFFAAPLFPGKYAGRVFRRVHQEPQNLP